MLGEFSQGKDAELYKILTANGKPKPTIRLANSGRAAAEPPRCHSFLARREPHPGLMKMVPSWRFRCFKIGGTTWIREISFFQRALNANPSLNQE